jgi:hypothetical protein
LKSENLLLVILTLAVLVSAFGLIININSLISKNMWTGMALQSGTLDVSVESGSVINFTTDTISWGSGRVNVGALNATLDTSAEANNVSNGNWTWNSKAFVIENIGNTNVSLNLSTGKTAYTLLGGSSSLYQFNVTNNESGSCTPPGTFTLGTWNNALGDPTRVCSSFNYNASSDVIRIDIKLVIPTDSYKGALSDTITATIWPAT